MESNVSKEILFRNQNESQKQEQTCLSNYRLLDKANTKQNHFLKLGWVGNKFASE